jgi:hypothetical protein
VSLISPCCDSYIVYKETTEDVLAKLSFLTPWSRAPLEKLRVCSDSKAKFLSMINMTVVWTLNNFSGEEKFLYIKQGWKVYSNFECTCSKYFLCDCKLSVTVILIYCRYTSIVAKLITPQSHCLSSSMALQSRVGPWPLLRVLWWYYDVGLLPNSQKHIFHVFNYSSHRKVSNLM